MPYTWQRAYVGNFSQTAQEAQWDEVYNVYGYNWTAASNPLVDLLADKPAFQPGKPHATAPNTYVEDFQPQRLSTSRMAQVVVTFKSSTTQRDISPLDRPVSISLESELIEIPTFRRLDGSLLLNTAGDLIHGETRKVPLRIFNFEKNVAAIPSWLQDYSDLAVNSDVVTIEGTPYAAGYLMLQKVRGTPYQSEQVNGATVAFRVLTFSLVYCPIGWDQKIYNRGLRAKPEYGGDAAEWIMDKAENGEESPTDEPRFLDADGKALPLPINPADVIELDGVGVTSLPFNSVLPLT